MGGTILAAKLAKERGWAINVGGGFHHCCATEGGGFCVYADISLCIHYAFVRLNISRYLNLETRICALSDCSFDIIANSYINHGAI